MHEFYYLASKGYVVYFCNPRGGRGYGEAHARAIWGGWGDARLRGSDGLGGSDGSRNLISTRSDGRDRRQLRRLYDHLDHRAHPALQGGGHPALRQQFRQHVGLQRLQLGFPEELNDKTALRRPGEVLGHSPIEYIGNAKTPTLVIHNENDLRCPIEQGEQVFVALKRLGVETEMVRFPDEFHGLSRSGRTDRRIARLNHILGWFEKFLK